MLNFAADAKTVPTIPLERLAIAFIPVICVLLLLKSWSLGFWSSLYAVGRMLLQLTLIGYLLGYIFKTNSSLTIIAVLLFMITLASWISLRSLSSNRTKHFKDAFLSILIGGGCTLFVITQWVLQLDPWFRPQLFIPLAGMIFSNSMNTVSLVAERYQSELSRSVDKISARNIAMQAALIPITNSLLAVGLVSIPGMMTGQVLVGVSPLIAARYQIMVMCMIYGSSGISAALYLLLTDSMPAASSQAPQS